MWQCVSWRCITSFERFLILCTFNKTRGKKSAHCNIYAVAYLRQQWHGLLQGDVKSHRTLFGAKVYYEM